jgi:hypothetical protein
MDQLHLGHLALGDEMDARLIRERRRRMDHIDMLIAAAQREALKEAWEERDTYETMLFLLSGAVVLALLLIGPVSWVISTVLGAIGTFVPLGIIQVLFVISAFFAGSLLYRLRCRRPLIYGTVEIVLGILFAGYIENLLLGYQLREVSGYFTMAGAIYIIVRGYDNIYRSLKWGSPVLLVMNRLFFGRRVFRKL